CSVSRQQLSTGSGDQGCGQAYRAVSLEGDFHFVVYLLQVETARCYFGPPYNMMAAVKTASAFTERGKDFSELKTVGDASVISFTGAEGARSMDCFAFVRMGPKRARYEGSTHKFRGHVCRTDGLISDEEIASLLQQIARQ